MMNYSTVVPVLAREGTYNSICFEIFPTFANHTTFTKKKQAFFHNY